MGSLLIVSGPPGAGKSTVARELAGRLDRSALVEGDAFFGFLLNGGVDPWLPAAHAQNEIVTRAAGRAAGAFAAGGMATVYDGVVGPWFLDAFVTATGLDEVDYVVLLPPEDECVARVANRRDHRFTDEAATRTMHASFARHELPARHVLTDPRPTAVEIADRIESARASGQLGVVLPLSTARGSREPGTT